MNLKYHRNLIAAAFAFALHANPEMGSIGEQDQQHGAALEGEHLPPEPAKPEVNLPAGAALSWADLGRARAKEIANLDEKIAETRTTLRGDVLRVLEGPAEAHPTYVAGFSTVMAEREAKGLDIRTLGNVRSQVRRVFKAFKANPSAVLAELKNSGKRWDVMLKALPKQSNAGRPSKPEGGQPAAQEGAAIGVESVEKLTDVGAMVESLYAIAARCREVAKGKKAYYGEYIAVEVLETLNIAKGDFQKIYADNAKPGGVAPDDAELRAALDLDRVIK